MKNENQARPLEGNDSIEIMRVKKMKSLILDKFAGVGINGLNLLEEAFGGLEVVNL